MKILKLDINQYRHLENISFDFTYQSGDRKGQPLDKICFIGQSATGKTSLLDLIFEQYKSISAFFHTSHGEFAPVGGQKINSAIFKRNDGELIKITDGAIEFDEMKTPYISNNGGGSRIVMEDKNNRLFYFKANIVSDENIKILTRNPVDLVLQYDIELRDIEEYFRNDYIEVFDNNVHYKKWLLILKDILIYRQDFTQRMSELVNSDSFVDGNRMLHEVEKWRKVNPNKIKELADKLNPILEKLQLEVDLVDTRQTVPLKNKETGEIIPIQNTSTGTKGLMLSFLPLIKLDTKDSLILIDEPERSLYPDMQMDLMEHYQNLAPDAQIIVATHSPFIAAAFEPEERFILYFDEKGKVAVRRGVSPIGDDPNDMLKNDFGVNYYNSHAEKAYKNYLNLQDDLVQEKDPDKKKEILLEVVKLGNEYNF